MIPERATALEQRKFLRGCQKFEIRPDGELEVTVKRFSFHNQFKFPLWHLNPSPTRRKFIPPGPIVGAVIFGLICAGFVVAMLVGLFTTRDWGLLGALAFPLFLFGIIFAACISKLLTMSVNANLFHFRNGPGQLLIWFGKPDEETFNDFCKTLSKKAEEAWNNRAVDPTPQSLAGELAALKKLKDSGALNEAEFERAKAKLLEQADQKRIGFA
jgi:hypothetical protein